MMNKSIPIRNFDDLDFHGIKGINVDKSASYRGPIDIICKPTRDTAPKQGIPLSATVIGLNNTDAPLPEDTKYYTVWNDLDAQEVYLKSKPTCYVVIGKPGSGAYSLGEALAKKLKCIHLSPFTILKDELEQQGPTGLCLDFNIRHNNKCIFDTLLLILKKKLESAVIQHRGYILTGFPLISSSNNPKLLITSLYSEEAVDISTEVCNAIVNDLKKKDKKKSDQQKTSSTSLSELEEEEMPEVIEEEQEPEETHEEEEETPKEFPKSMLDICSEIIINEKPHIYENASTFLKQFQEIYNIKMPPDVIIYLTSPDCDLITKKSFKYINYSNSQTAMEPLNIINSDSELRWPSKYSIKDFINPIDSHIFNRKYMCRQPYNFTQYSTKQLCNYKQTIETVVDKKLKQYGYNVVKLDSRLSIHEMMHHVMERLVLLPNIPVLVPELLYLEEASDNIEDFAKSIEQLNVINSCGVSFHRYMSPWYFRCPFELKKRKSVIGNTKLAVTFFKHVYCLSSFNAMIHFCKNPRPFLKLEYLEPTCRIIVVGTKSSGKTMISECLSWIFDSPVISYNTFVEDEKSKKYLNFSKSIFPNIVGAIEDDRFSQWQTVEMERYKAMEMWCNDNSVIIEEYLRLQPILYPDQSTAEIVDQSEIQNILTDTGETLEEIIQRFNSLKSQMAFLPFVDDIDELKHSIEDKQFLCQFSPPELRISSKKPDIPMIGDEDVSKAVADYIVANDLQSEVEPTNEELMTVIMNLMSDRKNVSKIDLDSPYNKYIIDGFTTNPECWELLINSKCLPDYIIALIENKEIDSQLIKYYYDIEKSDKDYFEKILLAKDPLITQKLRSGETNSKQNIAKHTPSNENILENTHIEEITPTGIPYDETAFTATFSESVDKFREEWDILKQRFDEFNKFYIEAELENKSAVEIIEEVLLKLRKGYGAPPEPCEDTDMSPDSMSDTIAKDVMANKSSFVSETNIYCPVTYYDYGVLWEGKKEFALRLNNQIYRFGNEEFLAQFQKDPVKYQFLKTPYKNCPPLRICVIGSIGVGKTTLSKYIAKELGLIHIDFTEILNEELTPKHLKKVGRKYENSFTDVPFDDEGAVEYQMDEENVKESLVNIIFNEIEIRPILYNYLEKGLPIPTILMHKILKKVWFESPFATTGFVLDGYPKTSNDGTDMLSFSCIPDLIIELEGNSSNSVERLSPIMLNNWKQQLNEAKANARARFEVQRKEWIHFITKNVVSKLLFEELLDDLFTPTVKPLSTLSMESVIIDAHPSGSSNVDANLFNIYNQMVEEFPEPEDQNIWESSEDVRERIDSRIEGIFENDAENIQSLKDLFSEQNIKIETLDATKSIEKVTRKVLCKLNDLRLRNISFLEETYVIDLDVAEILLAEGFYFFSKFRRMCPVQLYNYPQTILNPFKLSKKKGILYPVIHRSYIYFLSNLDNLIKFRNNPLKYADSNVIAQYQFYPLRIGIIGPPKSGKSVLAEKISKRYGLICISRGKAVRNIIKNLPWTKSASKVNAEIVKGEMLNYDLLMTAVQTEAIDHRTITYGYVLDGFPESASEGLDLSEKNLYPNIIFDISSSKTKVIENSQRENYLDIVKWKPNFPECLIEKRYSTWKESAYKIRDWINEDYQNIYMLDGNGTRWQCLQDAIKIIDNYFTKVHTCLSLGKHTAVLTEVLCISNDTFRQNMSNFKNICPLCFRKNIFRNSGHCIKKTGVVMYDNIYYWVCDKHLEKALNNPHIYLCNTEVQIPEIPAVVKSIDPLLVYENGICIVTYAKNLPAQKIIKGSNTFAANFKGKIYLFCSETCLEMFLARPNLYKDIVVFKETKLFPRLDLNKLPDLGYLEQTTSTILTDACCHVNVTRPKYPGLDIQLSGLIYVALYLKIHNNGPNACKKAISLYKKAFRRYEARCKMMLDIGSKLRSKENPFAEYQKCCSIKRIDSGTVEKPSSSITSSIHSYVVNVDEE